MEVVGRAGCHLCDDVEKLLRGGGVQVTRLDIDADPELFRLYDFRIPVVLHQGRVVAEGRIGPEVLAKLG